jgi:hypothetical protein
MKSHLHPADLRALSRLGIDAVAGVTDLVESLHGTIQRVAPPLGRPRHGRTRGLTGLVYRSVHAVTRGVGVGLDVALDTLLPLLQRRAGPPTASPEREAVLAALNGVLGDHLADSGNSLALPMQLRYLGQPLAPGAASLATVPAATGRLLVLVHGLCMNDSQWQRRALLQAAGATGQPGGSTSTAAPDPAADPWVTMARAQGFTPLHLVYNSGRHVSTNGRALARLLDELLARWPVPVRELALVGHSMGGLVARSACHYAAMAGAHADADSPRAAAPVKVAAGWLPRLRSMVFLGTPHHGAPLERGGGWIDLLLGASPFSAPFARLGQLRSAGVTDLRHGNVVDADWQGQARVGVQDRRRITPLPAGVACYAMAACLGQPGGAARNRALRWMGDGLVTVDSALGRHADPARQLALPAQHTRVLYGRGHLDLLGDPAVLAQLARWLANAPDTQPPPA